MFGWPIIGYLFLGGTGAGAFLLAVCGNLLDALHPTEASSRRAEALNQGFIVAPIALVAGIVLLLMDLGNPDRIWGLLSQPFASVLGTGAVVLGSLCALSLAFLIYQVMARSPRFAVNVGVYVVGGILAIITMSYTGLLLSRALCYDLWMTPWLVALFVASSLSCGLAAILVLYVGRGSAGRGLSKASGLAAFRGLALCLALAELAILVVFLADRLAFGGTADDSVRALLSGEFAGLFWVALVGGGFAVPAIVNVAGYDTRLARWASWATLAASTSVLIGGLALRYLVVSAGIFAPLVI